MNTQIIIAFSIYAFILTAIGYFFYRKNKNASSFILGDRSTNYFVTAVALQASDMSHWLFLGFPAVVYASGLIRIWEVFGLAFFMFLNWQFVAPKIRRATEKLQAITLFSYFEKRFKDNTGTIRILTSLISVIFFTFYITSGLVALGRLFEGSFGLPYEIGVFFGLATAIIYTLLGGFVAVAWCDFFQGLFALAMIVLVPTIAYFAIGGWPEITTAAATKGVSLNFLPSTKNIWTILSLILIWGPGYFGQPHLLAFFMGIDDPKKIKYAKRIGCSWQIIALSFSAFIGIVGLAYFNNGGEMIYVHLCKLLFHPLVAGFMLCAILAATLSTLDSQILTSGSAIAEDLYKKIFNKHASSKKILWISRLGSITISLIALVIAYDGSNTIYNLVNYAWAGMGSAFGPLVITSLYSKKINRNGAIAGIVTGAVISGIWPHFNASIPPLIPGFIASTIAIYVISYLTNHRENNVKTA